MRSWVAGQSWHSPHLGGGSRKVVPSGQRCGAGALLGHKCLRFIIVIASICSKIIAIACYYFIAYTGLAFKGKHSSKKLTAFYKI